MTNYKSWRLIDGKPRWIVVGEFGNIVNRNPNKEELKDLNIEPTKNKKYTNDELLEYLIKFYKENGRPPSELDFRNNTKYPNYNRYTTSFGSWNEALNRAGLQIKVNRFAEFKDNELLEYLIKFYKENERNPIELEFSNNTKYPSFYLYQKRFGSWNEAIKRAGLQANRFTKITDNELLEYLIKFYKENGRPPSEQDFSKNQKYPGSRMYYKRFGSWQKALKLVGIDVDAMVRKGVINTKYQKGRFFEIYVKEHFIEYSVDVSGDNCSNPFDGICPKGFIYDAKSARLINGCWTYNLGKNRGGIDFFYIGAFNEDYSELMYVWRIPGNFFEGNSFCIGLSISREFNIENMKEYEITDKFKWINNGVL